MTMLSDDRSGASAANASVSRPTIVLVHGAWHGAWCWRDLQAELHTLGLVSWAIDLPSTDGTRAVPAGMDDDAECIRRLLAAIDGPVLLIAHSYGGIPATQAAATADNVARLVYLAAFRLPAGQSLRSFSGMPETDDAYLPVPENPARRFYNDLPPEHAYRLAAQLVAQSSHAFTEPLTRGAEDMAAGSYVICENDQVLPPSVQEQMAAGISSVHRMATGHSPFVADPVGLAALLAAEAGAIA